MKTYEKVTINAGDVSWDIIRMTDESGQIWSVPIDEANSDYKAYLIWLEEEHWLDKILSHYLAEQ